jgi:hypothetical protein
VLARDGDAVGMDDMRFDPARPQPAGQPEAVPPGLERQRGACHRLAGLGSLLAPAHQQAQQGLLVGLELLQRAARDTGDNGGNQPARLAHLDDDHQRAVLAQRDKGPAQVSGLWHRALRRLLPATMMPSPPPAP